MGLIKQYVFQDQNNKFLYYLAGALRELLPASLSRAQLNRKLRGISRYDETYLRARLHYYNKLGDGTALTSANTNAIAIGDLKRPAKRRTYYFDLTEHARYFDPRLRIGYVFGDVAHVPPAPSVVKSRPVAGDNANSVLLKLNRIRHFNFVDDPLPFQRKKDNLVWRYGAAVPARDRFMAMYANHPLCDIGRTGRVNGHPEWQKPRLSFAQQLASKFVLCIEGHDVATSLKWIMSSNSVAVMPTPKFETWFLEGTLQPGVHYIQIRDDYADVEEKLTYYLQHPEEAAAIARNANAHVAQFKDTAREELLSLLVLEKYFVKTGQMAPLTAL